MDLAERILSYLNSHPPAERLRRRTDLDGLGPPAAVDRCLSLLSAERRVGSPGRDLWFPLHRVDGYDHILYLPATHLREMAECLLRREGAQIVPSPQEINYALSHRTHRREGVWGVPTFGDIGVDRPIPLLLLWGRTRIHTVYQERYLMPDDPPAYRPWRIQEPEELRQVAYRMTTEPTRLEKGI